MKRFLRADNLCAENLPAIVLFCISGPLQGREFAVNREFFRIGASPENELILSEDDYVSSNHAYLCYDRGTLRLTDQRSKNGTFVNNNRLTDVSIILNLGDRIRVGNSTFEIVRAPGQPWDAPVQEKQLPQVKNIGISVPSDTIYQPEKQLKQILATISLESIISGFQAYRETYKKVLQAPRRYAHQQLLPWQPGFLQSAISIFLYGVAISFLIYVPLIQKHGFELGKTYFLLQFAYSQLLLICIVHLSAKVFGGHGTLSQTATVYCIWFGVSGPIILLGCYPVFFYIPIQDFISWSAISNNTKPLMPIWVLLWMVVFNLLLIVIGFLTVFQWLADVHCITKRRLILALIFVYYPITMVYNAYIAPYVSKGIRLVSGFLQNLL